MLNFLFTRTFSVALRNQMYRCLLIRTVIICFPRMIERHAGRHWV